MLQILYIYHIQTGTGEEDLTFQDNLIQLINVIPRQETATAVPAKARTTSGVEPSPVAVSFSKLFACADRFDWFLMTVGSLAAVAHGTALIIYLHYFAKIIHVLRMDLKLGMSHEQFNRFTEKERRAWDGNTFYDHTLSPKLFDDSCVIGRALCLLP
ncbi:ABC transporter B family member 20 [Vigna angularis]|uniref:ABC transporter B family member 20 n=1 Tax=Phaseolus angularis TaxID=3914 RepID=A0A8T0KSS9_PHAAN|nr:ABC transporter B family member 20 [Vigna angularis]